MDAADEWQYTVPRQPVTHPQLRTRSGTKKTSPRYQSNLNSTRRHESYASNHAKVDFRSQIFQSDIRFSMLWRSKPHSKVKGRLTVLSGKRLRPELIRNSCHQSETLILASDGLRRFAAAGAAAGQCLAPLLPLLHGRTVAAAAPRSRPPRLPTAAGAAAVGGSLPPAAVATNPAPLPFTHPTPVPSSRHPPPNPPATHAHTPHTTSSVGRASAFPRMPSHLRPVSRPITAGGQRDASVAAARYPHCRSRCSSR